MADSRSIQVKVPQKTYEKLVEFTGSEEFVGASAKPIVAQTVFKMIRFFLDTDSDPEWENFVRNLGKHVWDDVLSCDGTYQKTAERTLLKS